MRGVRQLGLGHLAAELLDQSNRLLEARADAGLDPLRLRRELPGNPEAESPQVLPARPADAAVDPERGRVAAIAPLQGAEHERRVGDVPGQGPALVERGGEGDHPVTGDGAVGGLHPDDSTERRGLADRAAGVGADRARGEPAGDRRSAAARGSAGYTPGVPGVEHRPVAGVLVRGAHRELVHVRLAEHSRTGLAQLADRGRGVGRPVALEDPGAGGGRDALRAEDVLDGDRDARERALGGAFVVGGPGALKVRPRCVLGRPEVGVERVARRRLTPGVEVLVGS